MEKTLSNLTKNYKRETVLVLVLFTCFIVFISFYSSCSKKKKAEELEGQVVKTERINRSEVIQSKKFVADLDTVVLRVKKENKEFGRVSSQTSYQSSFAKSNKSLTGLAKKKYADSTSTQSFTYSDSTTNLKVKAIYDTSGKLVNLYLDSLVTLSSYEITTGVKKKNFLDVFSADEYIVKIKSTSKDSVYNIKNFEVKVEKTWVQRNSPYIFIAAGLVAGTLITLQLSK